MRFQVSTAAGVEFALVESDKVGARLAIKTLGHMASKRYKGKTCAYCGVATISATGDHVFARKFFLERHRSHLPQVPACGRCNSEKSKLETYLLQVMPLGAIHAEASETRLALMPKRSANPANKVLRQILEGPNEVVVLRDYAGLSHEHVAVLVDAEMLRTWCGLVARGLAFFHWGVATPDYEVETVPLSATVERDIFCLAKSFRSGEAVTNSVGNGAFTYRGFKCADGEAASVWMIQLYGAMPIGGDPTISRACAASWGVFITPRDRADAS